MIFKYEQTYLKIKTINTNNKQPLTMKQFLSTKQN